MYNKPNIFEKNNRILVKLAEQRRWWLYTSSIVVSCIIFLIFGWDWISNLHSKSIWWVVVSLMLIISINWWYWTMKILLTMIENHSDILHITSELLHDIKEIKQHIKEYGESQSFIDKDH